MKSNEPPLAPGPLLLGMAAAALLCGCGDSKGEAPTDGARGVEHRVVPGDDLNRLDELAELGYVDFAEPDAEVRSGVVLHEPASASPGYTLVTSLPNARAALIDMSGRELRAWDDGAAGDARWSRVRILRNGDVLCIAPKADVLSRMRFDGKVLWRLEMEVHHDGIELPDGRLLVLTRRFRDIPAIGREHRSVDNLLTFVSADGERLEEHSLYDLLVGEPGPLEVLRPPGLEELPSGYNIDPMHANTVFWLEDTELEASNPLLVPGRVLVTFRYLDSVALLDLETKRCVWAWGKGQLEGPHDASVLDNGHILVLDNGYGPRGWSRVVEMDPASGEVVWEYRAPVPERFHTSGRGTVQALPNGNVLIGNSNSGEAFEVDREGSVVWRFLNPLRDSQGARAVLRVERYPVALIEPLLGGG